MQNTSGKKLPLEFFRNGDVVDIARNLLGKTLYSFVDGQLCGGTIIETEAYRGPEDRGSHAYGGRRTPRNETMYGAGGLVYMYICYGIHDMLNIVTGEEGTSHALLIRAIEPTMGIDVMRIRRGIFDKDTRLCQGPGALAKAMGLTKLHNSILITGEQIWIEESEISFTDEQIVAGPRVGMNFDGPYKTIPWRFYVKGNKFVSKPHYPSTGSG